MIIITHYYAVFLNQDMTYIKMDHSTYGNHDMKIKYLQNNECLKLWSTRLVSNMSFFGCGKCSRNPLHCRIISIRIDSANDTPYTRNEQQEGHDNDPANHIGIFSIPIKKLFTHRWQWLPSGQLWDYHWIDYRLNEADVSQRILK